MTHNKKLDTILNGLLSRVPTRVATSNDDKRLTFVFLCDVLFAKEDHQAWETQYLENRLIGDGYMIYRQFAEILLPEITQEGIKFITKGGYSHEKEMQIINEKLIIQSLQNAKRGWIPILISIIALVISIFSCFK